MSILKGFYYKTKLVAISNFKVMYTLFSDGDFCLAIGIAQVFVENGNLVGFISNNSYGTKNTFTFVKILKEICGKLDKSVL